MPIYLPTDSDGLPCTITGSKRLSARGVPRLGLNCSVNLSGISVATGCGDPGFFADRVHVGGGGDISGDYPLEIPVFSGCYEWEQYFTGLDNPAPVTGYNADGCSGSINSNPYGLFVRVVMGWFGPDGYEAGLLVRGTTDGVIFADFFIGYMLLPNCDGELTGDGPFTMDNLITDLYTPEQQNRGAGGQAIITLSDPP